VSVDFSKLMSIFYCVGLEDKMTVGKITFLYDCSVYRKADQFDWPVQNGIMNYDILAKVGIRNFSPHFRNSAILRTTKSIAELRIKKSCGTAIADLQNLTSAIPQFSAVSGQFNYFLVPFPQLRMVLRKTQAKVLFLWNPKTCLKGTVARDFRPLIFF
jgi:hypothetical protein